MERGSGLIGVRKRYQRHNAHMRTRTESIVSEKGSWNLQSAAQSIAPPAGMHWWNFSGLFFPQHLDRFGPFASTLLPVSVPCQMLSPVSNPADGLQRTVCFYLIFQPSIGLERMQRASSAVLQDLDLPYKQDSSGCIQSKSCKADLISFLIW